jgi:hypothetical protein
VAEPWTSAITTTASAAEWINASLPTPSFETTRVASHGGSGVEPATESSTTLSGHGWSRLAAALMSIAANARTKARQWGRRTYLTSSVRVTRCSIGDPGIHGQPCVDGPARTSHDESLSVAPA